MAWGIVSTDRASGGSSNIEIADVTNASVTSGNKTATITWTDPGDVTLNGANLARWAGTLLVRKAGSEPTSQSDGDVVVNNTTSGAYASTGYTDTGLTNGTTYYYRLFPYSTDGVYTAGTTLTAQPAATQVAIPTITSGELTYNGTAQAPTWSGVDTSKMTKTETARTNAGDYSTTFTLKSNDYIWENGEYTAQEIPWSIGKANGSVTLSKSNITLNATNTSSTATITQVGDGALTASVSDSTIATASISGNTLTVTRNGDASGTCTVTVNAAASNNYKAASDTLTVTASSFRTMTVQIDLSNSNPDTCVTYADDAVGMTAGSDAWDDF